MGTPINRTAVALALGLATSLTAVAQTQQAPRDAAATSRTDGARRDTTSSSALEVRATKLIGTDVRNATGEKLGEVKDIVLDTNSGRVHYAVLSFGGVLGIGDKLFAFPLSKVKVDDKGRLVLDVTKDQLKSAPAFDSKRWPDWHAGAYRAELDRVHGASAADKDARFRRASDLLDAKVRDANSAPIGDIEDIVIDLAHNRVHYVVVEFDRAWNPNDKLVALPMNSLRSVATAPPPAKNMDSAAPPYNPPGALSLQNPSGPSKGTASATPAPAGVETRPPAMDPQDVKRIPNRPLGTTTSYADDEDLAYAGTRAQLQNAPAFDKDRYPDLRDPAQRKDFDRRLTQ